MLKIARFFSCFHKPEGEGIPNLRHMTVTIDINKNAHEASALLNYLRTLNYVKIQQDDISDAEKTAIDEGLEALAAGNYTMNDNVQAETRKRYPNLFNRHV